MGRFTVQTLVEMSPLSTQVFSSVLTGQGDQTISSTTSSLSNTAKPVSCRSIASRIASQGKLAPLKLKQADVKPKRKKSSKDKFSRSVATVFSGDLAKQMGIRQYFHREDNGPMNVQRDNSAQNVIGQEF